MKPHTIRVKSKTVQQAKLQNRHQVDLTGMTTLLVSIGISSSQTQYEEILNMIPKIDQLV